jgi:sugar phosphate permease
VENRRPKVFYGTYIVAAAVIIILYSSGIVYFGFTAVFEPIAKDFGWSYAQVSIASSLRGFEMGLLAPVVGLLVDRWGSRKLIFGGSILIAAGFLLLSRITSLAGFYSAFLLIAAGMSTCSGTVLLTTVTNWYRKRAALAVGIVSSGWGLGGLLVPLVTRLIDSVQWRSAMLTVGLGMLVIVLPLSFVFRHKPQQYGYLPDGDTDDPVEHSESNTKTPPIEVAVRAGQAVRSRVFWQIAVATACHAFVVGAIITHLMPYLSSVGIDRSRSSIVALLLPVVSILGRLSSGWLIDKIGSRRVFTIGFAFMALGSLILSGVTNERSWLVIPFVLALSLGWGVSVTTRFALLRERFGIASFGAILGFTSGVMMLGSMIGAPLAGWVYDTYGSYTGAWLGYTGVALVGMILVLTIPSIRKNQQPGAEKG